MSPSQSPNPNEVTFAGAFRFLLKPMRNKGAYGGRGSAKSHQFARALLCLASERALRIICARETMRSIADSVHALLADCIEQAPTWSQFYAVKKAYIEGRNGSLFRFFGLRHDPEAFKSLEGADILWMEEAQSIGAESLEKAIPTIRKPGSEIWASWNPRLETDPIHQRMVINPAPNTIAKKVSWRDNPWFPEELKIEMEHLRVADYQAYLHVWEGECKSAIEGAVYAAELEEARKERRVTSVPVDRLKPVHTFWDLGFGDTTAIWFAQQLDSGQVRLVDYLENRGKTIEWYVIQLQQRGYMYGTDWLPHDGVDAMIHGRLSGDRSRSPEMLLRAAGRNVRIAPKLAVMTGINAVRTIFPRCWFDEARCAQGLDALRFYQWGPPSSTGLEKREPLHDWASHGADAFRTMATAAAEWSVPVAQDTSWRPPPARPKGGWLG